MRPAAPGRYGFTSWLFLPLHTTPAEALTQFATAIGWALQLIFHRRDEGELAELLLEKARQSKFREKKEVVEMGLTLAQAAEARGEARGEERGLRRALKTVLTTRFGPLSSEVEAAVDAAGVEILTTWLPLASEARVLEEVGILPQEPPR